MASAARRLPREVRDNLLVGRVLEREVNGEIVRGVVKYVVESKFGEGRHHGEPLPRRKVAPCRALASLSGSETHLNRQQHPRHRC